MVSALVLVPSARERDRLDVPDDLTVHVCGVGLVAAALETARVLAQSTVEHCVLVGVAGTRDPVRAPVGTVVVGTAVRNEAIGAGHGEGFLALGEMGLGDHPDLLPLVPIPGARAVPGVIGTVAAASASEAEARAWRKRHSDVLVEEMEGWGVAVVCARAGVALSVVRAVSNVAGERDRACWDMDGACAALGPVVAAALG